MRSRSTNIARGTPSDLADLRHYRFRQASMSRGVEARGSIRTLGVPRALGFSEGPNLDPKRWLGGLQSERRGWLPERVRPSGAMRSRPTNTARGTPSDLADLRFYGLRQASMSRGVEARGSIRTLGVPRALVLGGAGELGLRPTRGRTKNTGDDARLNLNRRPREGGDPSRERYRFPLSSFNIPAACSKSGLILSAARKSAMAPALSSRSNLMMARL